jgi:ectoine hydroxylase-related dioxygenase (phytanoyl-CoA dioxygenase family)
MKGHNKHYTIAPEAVSRARQAVTQGMIDDFQNNGAVCFKQLLSSKEIALLAEGIEYNLKNLSERSKVASSKDDPGYFVEDFCNWQDIDAYEEIVFSSPLAVVAGLLTGSSLVRFYHDHMLVKEAHTQQKTPWHQDQPYYNIEGKQNCSFWIAVDPVVKKNSLEFVAGSHLGPWLMPRSFLDNQAKWFPDGSLAELPKINDDRAKYPIISWDITPGDVVCFHMLTLHSASGVDETRRRVFSARFIGDDVVHAPRPWRTSPEFTGLADELDAGVPMDHPLFPVVWEA